MSTSVQERSSAAQETPSRRDPLVEMLRASFETQTATIPLDDPAAIVQVLQERCRPDILRTVQQTLEVALAHLVDPEPSSHLEAMYFE